jgi:hypothetical protein
MAMVKRWFEANERTLAKREAKAQGVKAWVFTKSTREGKKKGFYVGPALPKILKKYEDTVEQVWP